ncbi:MAG: hypothetical protein Q8N47_12280 [Bryobacterales bacterium]|nr:hypothetical protein [Bryobacterales bacterium]
MRLNPKQRNRLAVLLATACLWAAPVLAQKPAADGGQQLEGAWTIELIGDPPALSVKTSGLFTQDGAVFIQNVVPDVPGTEVVQGVGEWARSGNREFDLTWIYLIVSPTDGSYMGVFKDRAKIRYNADGTALEGNFAFQVTLADGSQPFVGAGKFKAVRVRIDPLP